MELPLKKKMFADLSDIHNIVHKCVPASPCLLPLQQKGGVLVCITLVGLCSNLDDCIVLNLLFRKSLTCLRSQILLLKTTPFYPVCVFCGGLPRCLLSMAADGDTFHFWRNHGHFLAGLQEQFFFPLSENPV